MKISSEWLRELIDYNPKTGRFTWKEYGPKEFGRAGSRDPNGYVKITVKGRSYLGHRLAWLYVYGVWPTDEIDHINGKPWDNRIENLRAATRRQNIQSRRMNRANRSGFKGVCRFRDKWRSTVQGKHLGLFATAEEAHLAYCVAARELFGEFAKTA